MQVKRKFKRNLEVEFREYKVAIRDLKGKKLESGKKGLIGNSKKNQKEEIGRGTYNPYSNIKNAYRTHRMNTFITFR